MRRARWKRKSVCSKLAHRCKFGGNGFCENPCANEELPAKSRAGCRACPALYAVLIVASNLRVQRGHPLPPFPLPLPLSLEGFPKGRAAARPFVSFQGGAGGNRNPPGLVFFSQSFLLEKQKKMLCRTCKFAAVHRPLCSFPETPEASPMRGSCQTQG